MKSITINGRRINRESKPYFIADIAANHDGDIERAYRLVELAKESGADAAKFQNFTASKIVSRNGFDTMGSQLSHQSTWKKSVYDVYDEASISLDWTEKLKRKCDEVGIEYMTSPYDFEAVDSVYPFLNAYKIGSGDITWTEIIRYIGSKGKPVLLATGASTMEDVKRAINILRGVNEDIVLMQCNTNYTASDENFHHINLNVLKEYERLFPEVILGLSDHTFGHETVLGAIAMGARVIEKHFTDDNDRVGPDHKFSMNPNSWRAMVDASYRLFYALGDGEKKVEANELDTVCVQRRGLYLSKNMEKGQVLKADDLIALRPITDGGIEPHRVDEVIGCIITEDLPADTMLKWEALNDKRQ